MPGSDYYENVIVVADSFYDGTWGSGALPEEIIVFEICSEFGWTPQQFWDIPPYWRRVFVDLLQARRIAERDRIDREKRRHA